MTEILLGTLTMVVLVQFSALWYRMGKIEGQLKKLNGHIITNRLNGHIITNRGKEDEP